MKLPKVTFGIIVLNGEPLTRYCLRALYPFAHQIIVVEGAVRSAALIATPEGHSRDGTLEQLYRFKAEEDPENKIQIVTQNGFWSEKDEQSQAYAALATGDYLWQVDIDEFYRPDDMERILEMLDKDEAIAAVSFQQISFWGGFDYLVDGWYLRRGAATYHRLFKWGPGYRYTTHRPPTVQDTSGTDLREQKWISGHELAQQGIRLYHYSLLFPQQVRDKCAYYQRAEWAEHARLAERWAQETFVHLRHPFRVHNVYADPSWIERFRGTHPPQIQQLRADLEASHFDLELRRTDDIEVLLRSPSYRAGRALLKFWEPFDRKLYASNRHAWLQKIVRTSCSALGKLQSMLR